MSDLWKKTMFVDHAVLFAQVVESKGMSESFCRSLLEIVGETKLGGIVLDLGCGNGRLTEFFASRAKLVVGLDNSGALLRFAKERHSKLANATFFEADMRALPTKNSWRNVLAESLSGRGFPGFSLICRSYTSLGYFPRNVELDILKACRQITSQSASIVLDTFNAEWFRVHGQMERRLKLESCKLLERYSVGADNTHVDCEWIFERSGSVLAAIPFVLEAYRESDVERLLEDAGWSEPRIYADYSTFLCRDATQPPERLVAVAATR
jgi:SAM-dependent methyltransferase